MISVFLTGLSFPVRKKQNHGKTFLLRLDPERIFYTKISCMKMVWTLATVIRHKKTNIVSVSLERGFLND